MKNTTRLFVVAMILMAVIAMCVGCNVTGNTKETEAPTAEQTDVKATEAPTEEPTEKATTDDTEPAETVTEPAESETVDVTETQTEAATEPVEPATEVEEIASEWKNEAMPTCTLEGVKHRTVTVRIRDVQSKKVISEETKDEYENIPALGHSTDKRSAVMPTCSSVGLTEEEYCVVCGEVITPAIEVPADSTLHVLVTLDPVPATCATEGLTEGKVCSACGKVVVAQTETPATGHHKIVTMPDQPATCCEPATHGGTWCSVCNMIVDQPASVGEALGHEWDWFVCQRCGEDQTSKGLEFIEIENPYNEDGSAKTMTAGTLMGEHCDSEYFGCVGCVIGTCTDSTIIVPKYTNDGRKVVLIVSGLRDGRRDFQTAWEAGEVEEIYVPNTIIRNLGLCGIIDEFDEEIFDWVVLDSVAIVLEEGADTTPWDGYYIKITDIDYFD